MALAIILESIGLSPNKTGDVKIHINSKFHPSPIALTKNTNDTSVPL